MSESKDHRIKYIDQIMQASNDLKEPGAYKIVILHDDWCDLLNRPGGKCNCNPEVQQPVKDG